MREFGVSPGTVPEASDQTAKTGKVAQRLCAGVFAASALHLAACSRGVRRSIFVCGLPLYASAQNARVRST